ncbi:Mu-like prophage protein gpG [Kingella potus]|uniref:Mu-like prophage protein gpG n=1 Tax=Kingella potus TaxID=265175 RepID=A0A377QXW3_9NEIS|nr:phage virion morphogenesis protein [Kingella potus]UOP00534.1 phage virion morphogenesis protein [Kingella potus]UOP02015.1 phage virion morphogenesis protein [Kingella potus]STQ99847.1 Mu-like prophage protein gpG [Kingella potus]
MRLTVDSELPEAREHLQTLYRALNGDLTRPMTGIAGILENSTRKRFDSKTAPDGSLWAGLKPATLRAKAYAQAKRGGKKNGARGGILVDRGDLYESLTGFANDKMAVFGTPQFYAVFHQTGTRHMPARPIFGLSEQNRADIRDLLAEWLEKAWKQS